MPRSSAHHLPLSAEECKARGWDYVDVVLVSGDAYVDHPSFGIAIIARMLENHGLRVAILSQPRHHNSDDFRRFGKPRLFFGISAGNLDSIVANYSGNGKVRDYDAYSQDGVPWWPGEQSKNNRKRPDRATLIYANLARSAYRDVPIILGGIEASLRRFVHFDYKQQKLRASVLTDGKADLLIYGMGERAIIKAAEALQQGQGVDGIPGSCIRLSEKQFQDFSRQRKHADRLIFLPSWDEIGADRTRFLEAETCIDKHGRSLSSSILVQKQQNHWVVQIPDTEEMSSTELDAIYDLPFTREIHPLLGDIPAYRMIRHSITIVRGCSGNCSFCAITRHQGSHTTSRSHPSVLQEARKICTMKDFSGTISDLGGPTANLYGTACAIGGCKKRDCLYPELCEHLQVNEEELVLLLSDVADLDQVKHVFISSGLRMGLLLKSPRLLEKILRDHTPGALKIAPEHTEKNVLRLMHKEPHSLLQDFVAQIKNAEKKLGRKIPLTPYIISAHPGCTERDVQQLVKRMDALGLSIRQFQDFTPTPGTLSTAMQVSGLTLDGKTVHIPSPSEKIKQRRIIERTFQRRKSKRRRTRKRRS